MTSHDRDALAPALNDVAERSSTPETLLADSHYGSTKCLAEGSQRNVNIVSPAQTPKGKRQGHYTLEDFQVDEQGRITGCPRGKSPVAVRVAKHRIQITFNPKDCNACSEHARCPASAIDQRHSRFQYTPDRFELAEDSQEFRDQYRWRAGVEATMTRLKHQMKMNSLRIRGTKMVRYVTHVRALGLNLRRCAAYYRQKLVK